MSKPTTKETLANKFERDRDGTKYYSLSEKEMGKVIDQAHTAGRNAEREEQYPDIDWDSLKEWYDSYDNAPPVSSVMGLVARKCKQARQSEREELLEMVEGMEKPVDWEYTDTYNFDLYAGYRQALTDIKNHLTE